jgi:predicted Zn-dependent protease
MPTKSPRQIQIEALLADDPHDAFLRYGYAMEYVSSGQLTEGVQCLRELIATAAEPYIPAYLQAGQVLIRLDEPDEAATILRQGVALAQQVGDLHAAGEMHGLLATLG